MSKFLTGLLLLQAITVLAQQPNVFFNGTVTEGPAGYPVAFHPVTATIQIGNDSLQVITETVATNDSGFYSLPFYLDSTFAFVEISTPDCNGTILVENLVAYSGNTYITDFNICSLFICQAFFSFQETDDLAFQFFDESIGQGLIYSWDFGDNSYSSDQDPFHLYSQPGIYEVCLTISSNDSLCFDMFCQTLFAGSSGGCQAQYTYYPDTMPAVGAVQFIDFSTGNTDSWWWDFGDGTSSTEQNPYHVFPGPGTYPVCLSISGAECQSTWCANITVDSAGDCFNYFTYQAAGNTVLFSGVHSPGVPATYLWDFGDGSSGEGQQAAHTYPAPGTYFTSLVTSDSSGCSAISGQVVVVGDTVIFSQVYGQVIAGNFPMRQGHVTIFSTSASPGFTPFSETAGVDSSGIFIFPYIPNGEYILYAVPAEPGGYAPSYSGSVLHWNEAEKITTGSPAVTHVISLVPSGAGTWSGAGAITGRITQSGSPSGELDKTIMLLYDGSFHILGFDAINPEGGFSFTGLEAGTYYLYPELAGVNGGYMRVDLEEGNMMVDVIMNYNGISILGEEELSLPGYRMEVFPNPAGEHAWLSIHSQQEGKAGLVILDLSGRQCLTAEVHLKGGSNEISLTLAGLNPGLYFIRVTASSGEPVMTKFIKR